MDRMHTARYGGKCTEMPCPHWAHLPFSTFPCSPTSRKFTKSHCSRDFIEFNYQLPHPFPFLEVHGWYKNFQLSDHFFFLLISPHPDAVQRPCPEIPHQLKLRCAQKGFLMNRHSCCSGSSKGFRNPVPGARDKEQQFILLCHNFTFPAHLSCIWPYFTWLVAHMFSGHFGGYGRDRKSTGMLAVRWATQFTFHCFSFFICETNGLDKWFMLLFPILSFVILESYVI